MVGNESEEENIDKGLTVKSSTNLLTGRVYWISEKSGVVKKRPDNSTGGAKPFSEYAGTAGFPVPRKAAARMLKSDPGEARRQTIFSGGPKAKSPLNRIERASAE